MAKTEFKSIRPLDVIEGDSYKVYPKGHRGNYVMRVSTPTIAECVFKSSESIPLFNNSDIKTYRFYFDFPNIEPFLIETKSLEVFPDYIIRYCL